MTEDMLDWTDISLTEREHYVALSRSETFRTWRGDSFGLVLDHYGEVYDLVNGTFIQVWDGGE